QHIHTLHRHTQKLAPHTLVRAHTPLNSHTCYDALFTDHARTHDAHWLPCTFPALWLRLAGKQRDDTRWRVTSRSVSYKRRSERGLSLAAMQRGKRVGPASLV